MSSTTTLGMNAGDWAHRPLGQRTVEYTERDAILYALAVGASHEQLDLVFEDQLRVLPTFAMTLCQWAPDILAGAGAFDTRSVHGSQILQVHKPLPRSGAIELNASVGNVWDKGKAAIFEVIVESEYFTGTWSIFAPGFGGYGGERGPGRDPEVDRGQPREIPLETFPSQAALYRLTGDLHPIHIDPKAAEGIGAPRPILHGLATLAAATIPLAESQGAHPADLVHLAGRFTGQVFPGDHLTIRSWTDGSFDVARGEDVVVSGGEARFS